MTNVVFTQNNFSKGQFSDLIVGRPDWPNYGKGAKELTNVSVMPTGGVERRFGLEYLANVTHGTSSNKNIRVGVLQYRAVITYAIIFVNDRIHVYKDGVEKAVVVSPYSAGDIQNIDWAQSDNRLVIAHEDYKPRILFRAENDETDWKLEQAIFREFPTNIDLDVDLSDVKFKVSHKSGETTLTADTAVFTEDMEGGLFYGSGGIMRLQTFKSSTVFDGFVIAGQSFIIGNDTPEWDIIGKDSFISTPVFSDSLGWPNAVAFFQDRLIFGGSPSFPSGVFMSRINDFFNFDDSTEEDADDAISTRIGSEKGGKVKSIIGRRTLNVFSNTGLYTSQNNIDQPVTPDNAAFSHQSSTPLGDPKPANIDGMIIYPSQNGLVMNAAKYDVNVQNFQQINLSVATDVIKNPVSMASVESPPNSNAQFLYSINEDGTMAIFTSLAEQEIAGWSLISTDGDFVDVASDGTDAFFVIKRTVGDRAVFFLEKVNHGRLLDSSLAGTVSSETSTISGLSHLEGDTVSVIAGGQRFTGLIVENAEITLPESFTGDWEVGLIFKPKIRLMPPNVKGQNGFELFQPKSVEAVGVYFVESQGIAVEGTLMKAFRLPFTAGDVPEPKTGYDLFQPMAGFDPLASIELTQDLPYPLKISNVQLQVNITTEAELE